MIVAIAILLSLASFAQVDVTATGGTANASYTTLKDACDAINAGTHTTVITISITGNTSESATSTLNASGAGSASYTSITISPSGGAARTISGAAAAGRPLIDLNGADNVTIDGLNSGGNSLTITNTTVALTMGTSTIRFINDACNNTITNCSIRGAATMHAQTAGGTVFFSTSATGTTGNDNNTVSYCDIGPSGTDLPTKGIHSTGTANIGETLFNSGNTVTNCNIFDFFNAAQHSAGISIGLGNTEWTISTNKFYQTATRTFTSAVYHAGILTATNIYGYDLTITGNTIGYSASNGTGVYTLTGNVNYRFYGLYFLTLGAVPGSTVDNNTITAISVGGTPAGTLSSAPFAGIMQGAGVNNLMGSTFGNTIGSTTTASAITVSTTSAAATEIYGIYSVIASSVANNKVGGIAVTNSTTNQTSLIGIRTGAYASVTSNTVGYSSAPLTLTSNAANAQLMGINVVGNNVNISITGNTVRYLESNTANTGTGNSAALIGLRSAHASGSANTIGTNTISALSSVSASAEQIIGILVTTTSGPGTGIYRNLVHSFSSTSGSQVGIYVLDGIDDYRNNMIRLGLDAGGDVTGGVSITGIREDAGTNNFYFNSVYIGGTGVTGSADSYAFRSSVTTNTRVAQNNIFMNARSNGTGTGKHYGVAVGGSGASPTGLTMNYNDYFVSGTGGVFGSYNGSDVTSFANWKNTDGAAGSGPGLDGNSFHSDPKFVAPTAATPDLHVQSAGTPIESRGTAIVAVTDDYDGEARASFTPTDIGADAGNFTASALPVTFFAFTARSTQLGNLLQWTTATESDNKGFEVQRSSNGLHYEVIGFVYTAALYGNSSSPLAYQFVDAKGSGTLYYRLRQVDLDGRFAYSKVVMIKESAGTSPAKILSVYPNPARERAWIRVSLKQHEKLSVMVTNISGTLVHQQWIELGPGIHQVPLDLHHLPAGNYRVNLSTGSYVSLVRQ